MKKFAAMAMLFGLMLAACASNPPANEDATRARANAGYSDLNSETGNYDENNMR